MAETDKRKSAKDPAPVVLVLGIHVVVAVGGDISDWRDRDKSSKKE